jgi:hypothetical protein
MSEIEINPEQVERPNPWQEEEEKEYRVIRGSQSDIIEDSNPLECKSQKISVIKEKMIYFKDLSSF